MMTVTLHDMSLVCVKGNNVSVVLNGISRNRVLTLSEKQWKRAKKICGNKVSIITDCHTLRIKSDINEFKPRVYPCACKVNEVGIEVVW